MAPGTRRPATGLETAAGCPPRLPKISGADVELANFIIGGPEGGGTVGVAARALLDEIDGLPRGGRRTRPCAWPTDERDRGRRFLTNGGCAYIDLDHLEICVPEVRSARDHVAAWHAMLRVARGALARANARRPAGSRIHLLANNSDGLGQSYGSHLNLLVSRRAWDHIFARRLHYLQYLGSYLASSLVLTGQGKVGSECGAPPVAFQLSQRADFIETMVGPQTTYHRPLVNSRDEPLCGSRRGVEPDGAPARLHVICYDSTLCHVATFLKVGGLQIVLAMLEAERVAPGLILDDPVQAARGFSHDPTLQARMALASGGQVTALELQRLFLDEARRFAAAGDLEPLVPDAGEILALWDDTLLKLEAGDLGALAPRLDWVLKLWLLQRAMRERPGLTWRSPAIKQLDHLYASLDPDDGLYLALERSGLVERVVTEPAIDRLVGEPPDDTRAWTRATLLRLAAPLVDDVDWDSVRLRLTTPGGWTHYRRLELPHPGRFTRAEAAACLEGTADLEAALANLCALDPRSEETPHEHP